MVTSCNLPTVQYKYMYSSVHRSGFLETESKHAFYIILKICKSIHLFHDFHSRKKKCSCHRYNLKLLNTCFLN